MSTDTTIEIDGSIGEGGGQIVRSSLALSLVTGRPFRVTKIRAGRRKPGLLRQHLTAVRAATEIGDARVEGDALGSDTLEFAPRARKAGSYRFSVGTAGSTTLVLQAILPALMTADGPSELVLEGGTHNPFAPPFDFVARVLLPVLERMGPRIRAELERPGFFPAGGGRFRVTIEPVDRLRSIELMERGEITGRRAVARVSNLAPSIAERELRCVGGGLGWDDENLQIETVKDAIGPGNVLTIELVAEHVTEIFTGFGRREASAERVAGHAVQQVCAYLGSGAPVGPYLADQLLVPFAVAGGGRFRTGRPTRHTLTNVEIVRSFLDVAIDVEKEDRDAWTIAIDGTKGDGS